MAKAYSEDFRRKVIEAIEIKKHAASRRGMEADLLPNPWIRIASLMFRRRAAGNLTHTRLSDRPTDYISSGKVGICLSHTFEYCGIE